MRILLTTLLAGMSLAASLRIPTVTSPYRFASRRIFKCPSCITSVQKTGISPFSFRHLAFLIDIEPVSGHDAS